MSAFDALFAFYGLLLGLAIAAVTSGFGEQWRRRRTQPLGRLVPLLALYVLFATTQQWLSFWKARADLGLDPARLLMCLGMALPYSFVAQVLFPGPDEHVPDGDSHYLANCRNFLGVLMMPLALSLTYNALTDGHFPWSVKAAQAWFAPLVLLALMIVLRRRAWHVAGLLALIGDRLLVILS